MNTQFPAHCEVLQAMSAQNESIGLTMASAIYRERLTEQLNQLQDLKFKMADSIDNHEHRGLEPAYQHLIAAYDSILAAIRTIPQ